MIDGPRTLVNVQQERTLTSESQGSRKGKSPIIPRKYEYQKRGLTSSI
jgi:hypothetical protein